MPAERNATAADSAAEVEALDIRAQMKAARRNITVAAACVLAPEEPRSFRRDAEPFATRRRGS